MTKKFPIIGIVIAILISVLGFTYHSFSQNESIYVESCTTEGAEEADSCCVAYSEAIGAIESAWNTNLVSLANQEEAASEMVDDAFEDYRTFNCWLEYTCRSVLFSGYASPKSLGFEGSTYSGLSSAHIGTIPGCQDPEDMGIPDTWDTFVNFIKKEDWEFITEGGSLEFQGAVPESYFSSGGIPFIPQCMTDFKGLNTNPSMSTATFLYDKCMDIVKTKSEDTGFAKLTSTLRKTHADQRSRALESKFKTLIPGLLEMKGHVEYFKTKLSNLDSRYACYPPKCT